MLRIGHSEATPALYGFRVELLGVLPVEERVSVAVEEEEVADLGGVDAWADELHLDRQLQPARFHPADHCPGHLDPGRVGSRPGTGNNFSADDVWPVGARFTATPACPSRTARVRERRVARQSVGGKLHRSAAARKDLAQSLCTAAN